MFEWVVSRCNGRSPCDLYHSALEIRMVAGCFVIEVAPAMDGRRALHGVVGEGAVGTRWAGRSQLFRYEVRCWPDGAIPDVAEAVDSPLRLTDDPVRARRILELVAQVPVPVWGRDELAAGEMWNSNSVVSWLLEASGLDAAAIALPAGGRAPGWSAGIVVARRA